MINVEETEKFLQQNPLEEVVLYILQRKMNGIIPFEKEKYERLNIDDLVLFTMVSLEKLGYELTFEHIMVATFIFFRDKFCILGFDFLTDGSRLAWCFWRLKKRALLVGNNSRGFALTEKGRKYAETETAGKLEMKTQDSKPLSHRRLRRMDGLIKETVEAPAYIKYFSGQKESINTSDICYALQGTLNTPRHLLKSNLDSLKNVAAEMEDEKVLEFLIWIEKRFAPYLQPKKK